jgi:translation elongation factor EF-Tu-like GTPase
MEQNSVRREEESGWTLRKPVISSLKEKEAGVVALSADTGKRSAGKVEGYKKGHYTRRHK